MPDTRIGYIHATPADLARDLIADLEYLSQTASTLKRDIAEAAIRRAIDSEAEQQRLHTLLTTCDKYDHADAVGHMLNWQRQCEMQTEMIVELNREVERLRARLDGPSSA